MKLLKKSIFVLPFIVCCVANLSAQSNIKSYDFKKGEILDILLLTTKPEGNQLFNRYKKTAFPIAIKRSYTPLPGFKIKETTQGNIQPTSFLIGKWNDLENREAFIDEIETYVPDFHEQRRSIWSIFNLVYYEIPNDISFKINKEKYNVVTAYWESDTNAFTKFKNEWIEKAINNGGNNILELTNGKSPLGYYYKPDYLVVTEWDNEASFKEFYKKNLAMDHAAVLHMNQFIIN